MPLPLPVRMENKVTWVTNTCPPYHYRYEWEKVTGSLTQNGPYPYHWRYVWRKVTGSLTQNTPYPYHYPYGWERVTWSLTRTSMPILLPACIRKDCYTNTHAYTTTRTHGKKGHWVTNTNSHLTPLPATHGKKGTGSRTQSPISIPLPVGM